MKYWLRLWETETFKSIRGRTGTPRKGGGGDN
jgi:hypothetical protein